jgi:hypothetical protein
MDRKATTAPTKGGNVKTICRYIITFKAYLAKASDWLALAGFSL